MSAPGENPGGAAAIPAASFLRELESAVRASDLPRASAIASEALGRGFGHPAFFNARALWLEEQGKFEEALAEYGQANALAPGDPNQLNVIGLCQLRLDRVHDAIHSFDAALAVRPGHALTHYRSGWARGMVGDHDGAQRSYERAIALEPNLPDALTGLASILVAKGETAKARAYAERALAAKPAFPPANMALAAADLAASEFKDAESRLRLALADLAGPSNAATRARAEGLLGDALDGQGRFAEAFAAYAAENDGLRALYAGRFAHSERPADGARRLLGYLENAPTEAWNAPGQDSAQPVRQHVFVLGFMRSGTTLISQALAGHPKVVALEESDPLHSAAERFLSGEAWFNALTALPASEAEALRQEYWDRVRGLGVELDGKAFVDKHPLNTLKLPLISKLFPHAKIVFVARDPRDVVLSCFRRHLEINPATFAFLTLQESAEFYGNTMQFAQSCREKLPLDLLAIRYEDVVADFDTTIRGLCDFIGLEWSESMRDVSAGARRLGIRSPNAVQLRRGLVTDSAGRWRDYEAQLAPVLPLLDPWIDKFGYR